MTASVVPEWIKSIRTQNDNDTLRAKVAGQRASLLKATKEARGPGFWKQFLKEIEITVGSLHLIQVRARVESLGGKDDGHQVFLSSSLIGQTSINFFYDGPESWSIRCLPEHGDSFRLEFDLDEADTLVVRDSRGGPRMTPEQAAQYVFEPMAKGEIWT